MFLIKKSPGRHINGILFRICFYLSSDLVVFLSSNYLTNSSYMKTAQIKTIKLSEESHTKEHKRCLSEKCPRQIQEQPYLLQGLLRNLQLNLTEMSTHVADSWEVLKVEIRAKHTVFFRANLKSLTRQLRSTWTHCLKSFGVIVKKMCFLRK